MVVRKRVLVLNQFAVPRDEAGGTRHIELFQRLQNWDFCIIAGNRDLRSRRAAGASDPHFRRVSVPHYDGNGARRVLGWVAYALQATVAGMVGERPDVVYASSPHPLTLAAGWVVARTRQAKFVVEIRDLWPESLVSLGHLRKGTMLHRGLSLFERWSYQRADHIVGVTSGWNGYFARRGIFGSKYTVLSNCAEPSDFIACDRESAFGMGVASRGRVLLYAGSQGVKNGLGAILDAAGVFRDATFVFVGDGTERSRLRHKAAELDLNNVHFLDPVPKIEMTSMMGAADIGVLTASDASVFRMGLSPNKLYDYMAAGLPVLNNAQGEPAKLLEVIGCGVSSTSMDLTHAVGLMLELSDAELTAMGERGRRWMEANRSRSIVSAELEKLLDRVVRQEAAAQHA